MKEFRHSHPDRKNLDRPQGGKPHVRITEVHAATFIDSTGVPLTSDRGKPEAIKDIDFDYRPNTFRTSPSRYPDGKPHEIPVSGLEQRRLGESYRDMMQTISEVRNGFIDMLSYPKAKTEPLNAHEFLAVLGVLRFLPHYLAYRSHNPMAQNGEIPPMVMVLTNSASGTKGALGAWMDVHESEVDYLNKVPDVDEMITLIENIGSMAPKGGKTVCAASPAQQRHFMDAVIYGPSDKSKSQSEHSFMPSTEIPSLIRFGYAINSASGLLGEILRLDHVNAQIIEGLKNASSVLNVGEEETTSAIQRVSEKFIEGVKPLLSRIDAAESSMNRALGREEVASSPISLQDINSQKALAMYPLVSLTAQDSEKIGHTHHNKGKAERRRRMFFR